MSHSQSRQLRIGSSVLAGLLGAVTLAGGAAGSADAATLYPAGSTKHQAGTTTRIFASGGSLTGPDDITRLGGSIFVAYQNGVGSQGEPSGTGNTHSTVVEYDQAGRIQAQWKVTGKVDGMTADRGHHRIVATVNEDGDSSLYTITPRTDGGAVHHYSYGAPLPHGGGTDSIAVVDGLLYVTASAPAADNNTTTYSKAALYRVTLTGSTATTRAVLRDNATATDAVTGKTTPLNLSDPDSSLRLPRRTPRFGGQLMLDSQGDSQEIFLKNVGRPDQSATVLTLNTQVDDAAVASACGTLYVTDPGKNQIDAIAGTFHPGQVFVSVPTDSTTLPGTLGTLDLNTGIVTAYSKAATNPKGLLFVPAHNHD